MSIWNYFKKKTVKNTEDVTRESGGQKDVSTVDNDLRQILREVLLELQKINVHLSLITDNEIEAEDIG